MKKTIIFLSLALSVLFLAGCSTKRLPSEDLEVPLLYPEEIAILKNPKYPANSKEKFQAIERLIEKVDFTFTREAKTIDSLLYHGDIVPDGSSNEELRTVAFNYQYGDKYIRLSFRLYMTVVLRATVTKNY